MTSTKELRTEKTKEQEEFIAINKALYYEFMVLGEYCNEYSGRIAEWLKSRGEELPGLQERTRASQIVRNPNCNVDDIIDAFKKEATA